MAVAERKMVDPLDPGQTVDVHVEMRSPSSNGVYVSMWRMATPTGSYFGGMLINSQFIFQKIKLSLFNWLAPAMVIFKT